MKKVVLVAQDSVEKILPAAHKFLPAVHKYLACGVMQPAVCHKKASSRSLLDFTQTVQEKRLSLSPKSASIDKTTVDRRRDHDGIEQTNKTQSLPHMCIRIKCRLHSDQAHKLLCFANASGDKEISIRVCQFQPMITTSKLIANWLPASNSGILV